MLYVWISIGASTPIAKSACPVASCFWFPNLVSTVDIVAPVGSMYFNTIVGYITASRFKYSVFSSFPFLSYATILIVCVIFAVELSGNFAITYNFESLLSSLTFCNLIPFSTQTSIWPRFVRSALTCLNNILSSAVISVIST